MNMKSRLSEIAAQAGLSAEAMQLPDCELDPNSIKVVMINEVVPKNPDDWFYSEAPDSENRRTAFALFEGAGVSVKNMRDILDWGIYITAALKTSKEGYTADPEAIKAQIPLLEAELSLFPNLKAIMLMGDVAQKMVNAIVKEKTRKNVIPSLATGRIHMNEYYWGSIRVFPSYIMTGKNLVIEEFKRKVVSDDIRRMMEYMR